MRIVAGKYGGRRLNVPPNGAIRPTSDKVRGAIFNTLHSRGVIHGSRVMDAFCGTGALGIEALSRGAQSCVFIDKSKESLDLARQHSADFGISDEAQFMHRAAGALPPRGDNENTPAITLALLDPPYNKDLIAPTLLHFHDTNWLEDKCLCVIETNKRTAITLPAQFTLDDERIYGDTRISYVIYAR